MTVPDFTLHALTPVGSLIFYDRPCSQIHTTGTDIYHSPDIVAAVTLFKGNVRKRFLNTLLLLLLVRIVCCFCDCTDNTFRDYAQGCWRMRDLGSGHSVHVLVRRGGTVLLALLNMI